MNKPYGKADENGIYKSDQNKYKYFSRVIKPCDVSFAADKAAPDEIREKAVQDLCGKSQQCRCDAPSRSEVRKKFPTAQPSMAGQPKAIPKIGLSAPEIRTLDTSNASRYLFAINVVTKNTARDMKKTVKFFLFRDFFMFSDYP